MYEHDDQNARRGRLDPSDWDRFRQEAHRILDASVDQLSRAAEGRVWTPCPPGLMESFETALNNGPATPGVTRDQLEALLPYGVGNTHPRFFGWVHGAGTTTGLLADIAAAAINANCGGRNHAAIEIERLVIDWARRLMGFPEGASGLIVSGTSLATIIAMKVARDARLDFESRIAGVGGARLTGYTSQEAHSCTARAFDLLGLGTSALRRIPVNARFEMDLGALEHQIAADRAAGATPFAVIGTAGSVNTGASDDLDKLAGIAADEGLWMHVDGAFGASAMLSEQLRARLKGIERAQSIAFDFHKWMQVNYDAGCVLVRDEALHRQAFADRPDYLTPQQDGLAAGQPWPVDYGPELSRGFRALKVWAQIAEHGTARLGEVVEANRLLAARLAGAVDAHHDLERLAPAPLNICCFRFVRPDWKGEALDRLNREIVRQLQLSGIAAPSTTRIHGRLAIRVNITNHRTSEEDIDLLVEETLRLGHSDAVRDAALEA